MSRAARGQQEAKRFMDDAMQNPQLLEGHGGCKEGESDGECYARIAREIGYDFTAAELLAEYAVQQESLEKTIGLTDAHEEELAVEELSQVAGGDGVKKDYCISTHVTGEWCWFSDSCSQMTTHYNQGNGCKYTFALHMCDADDWCLEDQYHYPGQTC